MKNATKFSKGDGWKILKDVTTNTALQGSAKEDVYEKKSKVIIGVSETFQKEARDSFGDIRVASNLAPHFKNKELKKPALITN